MWKVGYFDLNAALFSNMAEETDSLICVMLRHFRTYINTCVWIHTFPISHMHPKHIDAHRGAVCGRYPQHDETSCFPHAYVTPALPPPADHSLLYPPLGRKYIRFSSHFFSH